MRLLNQDVRLLSSPFSNTPQVKHHRQLDNDIDELLELEKIATELCVSSGIKELKAIAVGHAGYKANIIDISDVALALEFVVRWATIVKSAFGTCKALGGDIVNDKTLAGVKQLGNFNQTAKSIFKDPGEQCGKT